MAGFVGFVSFVARIDTGEFRSPFLSENTHAVEAALPGADCRDDRHFFRKRGRRRLNGVALTPSARVSKNQSERFVVPLLKSTMEGNRWML